MGQWLDMHFEINSDDSTDTADLVCKQIDDAVDGSEHVAATCTSCIVLEQTVASLEQQNKQLKQAVKNPAFDYSDDKPVAGLVSPDVANEFNMVEVYVSTGVFWFKSQMDLVLFNGNNSPEQTMSKAMDVFFDKAVLKESSAKGGGQFKPLDQNILNACLSFIQERWAIKEAALIKVVNDKCSNARRPKRTGCYSHEKYLQKRQKKSDC